MVDLWDRTRSSAGHSITTECNMKFRVERDALADAVAWAARSLASRPTVPVLAGLLLTVNDEQLSISGFDLEASTEIDLDGQRRRRRPGAGLRAGCSPTSPGRCRRTRSMSRSTARG